MHTRLLAAALSLFSVGAISAGVLTVRVDLAAQGPASPSSAPQNGAKPAAAAPAIGVVDIQLLFGQSPQAVAGREKLVALEAGFENRLKELDAEIKKAEIGVSSKQEGTLEHAEATLNVRALQGTFESLREMFTTEIRRQEVLMTAALYRDIEAAIAVVAGNRKLDLVLRLRPVPPADAPLKLQQAGLEAKEIWFSSKRLDVTTAVLAVLQAKAGGVEAGEEGQGADGKGGGAPAGTPGGTPVPNGGE